MKFYLSTIADVDFSWDDETQTESIQYVHRTGPAAKENGLGLELAEFCIAENCAHPEKVSSFFKENMTYSPDLILHAPYNELLPHAIEPAVVTVAEMRYGEAYALCEKYGLQKMVVHGNFNPLLYYPEWFIDRNIKFWKKFLAEHPGNCIIVLENVMESYPSLITDIVKGVDDPRFRMCLDIGHANLHPVAPEIWLEECAPWLSHLHIHNNKGPVPGSFAAAGDLHSALGNGIIEMEKLLKRANEINPDMTASLESNEIIDSVNWLKEKGFI